MGQIIAGLLLAASALHATPLVDVPPASPLEVYLTESLVALKSNQLDLATRTAQAAADLASGDARPLILLGRIAAARKDFSQAETLLKRGLTLDPRYTAGYRYLGDLYFHRRDFAAAQRSYAEFIQRKEKDQDAQLQLVYCLIAQKNWGAAATAGAAFDAFDSTHPGYYFAKAALARAQDHAADAQKSLDKIMTNYGPATYAAYLPDYLWLFTSPGG